MNIPAGFMQDAKGRLVPEKQVKPIDLARDELVRDIATKAQALNGAIKAFKQSAFADIAAFVQLSAEQYGASVGGAKGNVQLMSYDGRYKVLRAIAERISFDERLQAAKALIDECITEWSEGAQPELRTLVNDAFQVDKTGNVNVERVLGLRRLDIAGEKWARAMDAIADAITVVGSKSYIRIYERVGDSDEYQPIALDMAAV